MHINFNVQPENGLSDYLSKRIELEKVINKLLLQAWNLSLEE